MTARVGSLVALVLVVVATSVASAQGPRRAVGISAFQVTSGVYRVMHRPVVHRAAAPRRRHLASVRSEQPPTLLPQPSPVIPTDPAWSQEWGLSQIGAPAAWQVSVGSKPIIVAVIDSGVDPTQPDLQGALVPGADFADSSGDTSDQYGHGTMVAGVIAARPDNGLGGAGICWTCRVMPVKVLGADGGGTAQAIAEGIRYAADHG